MSIFKIALLSETMGLFSHDPLTAVMVAGVALSAVGTLSQANAASNAAKYNQQEAQYNETVNAQQSIVAQAKQKQQGEAQLGEIAANAGASGFSMSGSPLDVLQESAYNANMDVLSTKYNYQIKGDTYQSQANLYADEASSDQTGGYLAASGQLLSGGAKAYALNASTSSPGNSAAGAAVTGSS